MPVWRIASAGVGANGVRWINDSKATNVGGTEAALNGLHMDGTLHLLLGGDGKSANFCPLARYDRRSASAYCFWARWRAATALRPEIAQQTETMEGDAFAGAARSAG